MYVVENLHTVFPLKISHLLKTAHSGEGIEKNRPWAVFRRNTVYIYILQYAKFKFVPNGLIVSLQLLHCFAMWLYCLLPSYFSIRIA
jgi:hypothetical protein